MHDSPEIFPVALPEPREFQVFRGKGPDDADCGKGFVDNGGEPRELALDRMSDRAEFFRCPVKDHHCQGENGKGDEGKFPVDVK